METRLPLLSNQLRRSDARFFASSISMVFSVCPSSSSVNCTSRRVAGAIEFNNYGSKDTGRYRVVPSLRFQNLTGRGAVAQLRVEAELGRAGGERFFERHGAVEGDHLGHRSGLVEAHQNVVATSHEGDLERGFERDRGLGLRLRSGLRGLLRLRRGQARPQANGPHNGDAASQRNPVIRFCRMRKNSASGRT